MPARALVTSANPYDATGKDATSFERCKVRQEVPGRKDMSFNAASLIQANRFFKAVLLLHLCYPRALNDLCYRPLSDAS